MVCMGKTMREEAKASWCVGGRGSMLGCLLQKRRLWPCLCMGKEEATNPMHIGERDSWARDLDTQQKQPGSSAWEKLGAARELFAGVELKLTEAWGRGQKPSVLVSDQRFARVGTSLLHVGIQGYTRRVTAAWASSRVLGHVCGHGCVP